jgi:S1-C subfamily serine protease
VPEGFSPASDVPIRVRAVFWDDSQEQQPPTDRRLVAVAAVALVLALLGTLVSLLALAGQRREASAVRGDVVKLQRQLATLKKRDARLSGRLNTAEAAVKRKEAGIAPLAKRVLRSVFTIETRNGLGSAFVGWQEDGVSYLITAHHVVAKQLGDNVVVTRKAGGSWSGEIVSEDAKRDLAVVRINGRPKGAKPLWQRALNTRPRPGDRLLLAGSPYGLEGTVTTGIVSRVTPRWIQTDAAANPGNSGGPAVDERGRVVGVLVMGGGQNVNFVVPIRAACAKVRDC